MALSIVLIGGSPSVTYRLTANTWRIDYTRTPINTPLPGNNDPLLVDLGYFRPVITIEGILRVAAQTEGGVTIPAKRDVEDTIVRSWWNTTIQTRITIGTQTDQYVCKVLSCSIETSAGRDDSWTYRLQLATQGRTTI